MRSYLDRIISHKTRSLVYSTTKCNIVAFSVLSGSGVHRRQNHYSTSTKCVSGKTFQAVPSPQSHGNIFHESQASMNYFYINPTLLTEYIDYFSSLDFSDRVNNKINIPKPKKTYDTYSVNNIFYQPQHINP